MCRGLVFEGEGKEVKDWGGGYTLAGGEGRKFASRKFVG